LDPNISRQIEAVCVGSRDAARAGAFAAETGLSASFGSYDEVLASDVDVVYVPLPTSCHAEWVLLPTAPSYVFPYTNVCLSPPPSSRAPLPLPAPPFPHSLTEVPYHGMQVPKIATAGKHVLCEKPVARSTEELVDMLRVFAERGLIFMDGAYVISWRGAMRIGVTV
jgi:hypothetical protein